MKVVIEFERPRLSEVFWYRVWVGVLFSFTFIVPLGIAASVLWL